MFGTLAKNHLRTAHEGLGRGQPALLACCLSEGPVTLMVAQSPTGRALSSSTWPGAVDQATNAFVCSAGDSSRCGDRRECALLEKIRCFGAHGVGEANTVLSSADSASQTRPCYGRGERTARRGMMFESIGEEHCRGRGKPANGGRFSSG